MKKVRKCLLVKARAPFTVEEAPVWNNLPPRPPDNHYLVSIDTELAEEKGEFWFAGPHIIRLYCWANYSHFNAPGENFVEITITNGGREVSVLESPMLGDEEEFTLANLGPLPLHVAIVVEDWLINLLFEPEAKQGLACNYFNTILGTLAKMGKKEDQD